MAYRIFFFFFFCTAVVHGNTSKLLRSRCSKLEDKVVSLESSLDQVEQYGKRNNLVIAGIPDNIADDKLEDAVTSIMWKMLM